MIRVRAAATAYRVAAASLPLQAEQATGDEPAVVALPGGPGWPEAVHRAVEAGARGVVVSCPGAAHADEIAGLRDTGVPVVMERPWLRADLVGDARVPVDPSYRTVELSVLAAALPARVADAVGWLRELSGGEVLARDAEATRTGLIARTRTADGRPGLIVGSAVAARSSAARGSHRPDGTDRTDGGRLRVHVVGSRRVEVTIDDASGARTATVSDAAGMLTLPRRHESPERVALRRVLDAVDTGAPVSDLDDLLHDRRVAAQIVAPHADGDKSE